MKKILVLIALTLVMVMAVASPAMAVKPLSAATFYQWHLSADVMPAPPYGSKDIAGSDTASKLIVVQPSGTTEVALTGVMNGLLPNHTYQVYLGNDYKAKQQIGWNVTGDYTVALDVDGTPYTEYVKLAQVGGNIIDEFVALNAEGTSSRWNINSGTVSGSALEFFANYQNNLAMQATWVGTIAADGSMSGTWHDIGWNHRGGSWATTAGAAKPVWSYTGFSFYGGVNTYWLTFTTDEFGSASWHLNLRDANIPVSDGANDTISVWVNDGATMLISDNFGVIK